MSFNTIGDALKSKSREVNPAFSEVAIFKHLIKERAHSLDLVRELLSNAGAEEVGAKRIEISYTQDKDGHIFEITDDGCGMNYTGNANLPGRLDKFLGLSGMIGLPSDEFSWKGLGSKLAYQSRKVEIETCAGAPHQMYDVRVNEPWETVNNNNVPRPRISEHPPEAQGTKIKVIGHPPHSKGDPFTFDQIRTYLLHRALLQESPLSYYSSAVHQSLSGNHTLEAEQVPVQVAALRADNHTSLCQMVLPLLTLLPRPGGDDA